MSIIDLHQINIQIKNKLFEISYKIDCFNLTGDFDLSRYAEIYFKELLNIVYKRNGWNIEKAIKINQDTYDLYDKKNRVCIQVTSNCRQTKKDSTIKSFEKKHINDFDKLIILFTTKNKPKKENLKPNFDYEDFSITEFSSFIENNCNQEETLQIRDILLFKLETPRNTEIKNNSKTIKQIEKDFLRNRKLEKELKKELISPNYRNVIEQETLAKNPYYQFKDSRFILHSIADITYPNMDDESDWCRTFMYDFYERGILIWLTGTLHITAIINKDKEWYIKDYLDNRILPEDCIEVKIRILGKLPYENIVDYKDSDEYYNDYHLYCKYIGVDNTPYEEIIYKAENIAEYFMIELDKSKMIKC
jgi:hypothetical protein